jgi:hypothetical protein
MTENGTTVTNVSAFINARISHLRLVSEKVVSTPAMPAKEPQVVQLSAEASSAFTIGLDFPDKPTALIIGIDYKASLKIPDTEKKFLEYESRHDAQFVLIASTGFEDWNLMPLSALTPYLATMQLIALKKAEGALFELGLKGVSLPLQENFESDAVQK